jgi:CelD/BcsL family acetyltransferase involved in cellulose biosynthesis
MRVDSKTLNSEAGGKGKPTRTKARLDRPQLASVPSFSLVIVRSAEELAEHGQALDDLAANTLEPNVFYEPWMLLPALRAFACHQPLELALIYRNGPGKSQVLCGFLPLERQLRWKGLPISVLRMWRHVHCVLGTPLLRAEFARESWAFFMDWLAKDRNGCTVLELPFVTGDGPFSQLLLEHGNHHGRLSYQVEAFPRALFRRRATTADYLASALSGRRCREFKRLEDRLRERGQLDYTVLAPDGDVTAWIDAFLDLEARGWKGSAGTALASQEADCQFFRSFATEGFRRGRLMMLALHLDGRPIALKCNLLACNGSFAFKIAFDEHYAAYSPGSQLEIFNIEHLHKNPRVQWMDSCAIPDHPMINRLWLDRRTIQTVLIATGRGPSDFVVSLLPALRWLKRALSRRGSSIQSASLHDKE